MQKKYLMQLLLVLISNKIISTKYLLNGENIYQQKLLNNESNNDEKILKNIKRRFQGLIISAEYKLTIANTYADGFAYILKHLPKINKNITFKLINDNRINLKHGKNTFQLELKLNQAVTTIDIILDDVFISPEARIELVQKQLQTIDGSSLTIASNFEEVEKLIKQRVKKIDRKVKVLFSKTNKDQNLIEGDNKFKIVLSIDSVNIEHDVIISNVKKDDQTLLNDFINKIKNLEIDGSKFKVNNQLSSVKDEIIASITEHAKVLNANFILSLVNEQQKLVAGTNEIEVKIKLNHLIAIVKVKIINVGAEAEKIHRERVNQIIAALKAIDFSKYKITTNNNLKHLVAIINIELESILKTFDYNVDINLFFKNDDKLVVGTNEIDYEINFNDDSAIEKGSFTINIQPTIDDYWAQLINAVSKFKVDGTDLESGKLIIDYKTEILGKVMPDLMKAVSEIFPNYEAIKNDIKVDILDHKILKAGDNVILILIKILDIEKKAIFTLTNVRN